MTILFKFLRWVFEKIAAAALIAGLGLLAGGLWLFLKDNVDFEQWRQGLVREISGEQAKVRAARDDVMKRMDRIAAEITAEQERGRQADKVMANLKELESVWDRMVGNPEQQKTNAEQFAKMSALRAEVTVKVQELQQVFTRTTWERDGLDVALGRIEVRLRDAEARQSRVQHYLERTWHHRAGGLEVQWWVAIFLGLYFLGPTAGAMGLYFVVAPWVAQRRPVRLATGAAAGLPEVGESRAAAEIALGTGDRLWVREKFLQASDEGLKRRSRAVLDWRFPLTCAATGLVELVELRAGEGGDGRVTLSNQGNPHSELAVVTLAEGAALVLRPSFLAGVALPAGQRLRVRRRWQLFRWQAWMTLQLRFFEFHGPCRLVVAASRGVRVERLARRTDGRLAARRTNQDATMGFSPGLAYRPARAETFWSFYRGMNPLFDDLFEGEGVFLCQQVAMDGAAAGARKFWAGVWGGMLKAFGM